WRPGHSAWVENRYPGAMRSALSGRLPGGAAVRVHFTGYIREPLAPRPREAGTNAGRGSDGAAAGTGPWPRTQRRCCRALSHGSAIGSKERRPSLDAAALFGFERPHRSRYLAWWVDAVVAGAVEGRCVPTGTRDATTSMSANLMSYSPIGP